MPEEEIDTTCTCQHSEEDHEYALHAAPCTRRLDEGPKCECADYESQWQADLDRWQAGSDRVSCGVRGGRLDDHALCAQGCDDAPPRSQWPLRTTCGHCGREILDPGAGWANGKDLCHPDEGLDCYRLVTVWHHPMPCLDCPGYHSPDVAPF